MPTVTIELDDAQLLRAREIASRRNMSVEAYIERLVHVVTRPRPLHGELGPVTRSLVGVLPRIPEEEVARTIDEYRTTKYGQPLLPETE